MIGLKQLTLEAVCLSCDGCCRYAERDTVWAPLFLFEEIVELTEKNILPVCLFTHAHMRSKSPARIDLLKYGEGYICPCFDLREKKCKIYPFRPLDCRLYPFLLVRQGKKSFLAVDEHCPYAKESLDVPATREYVRALCEFLRSKEFVALVKDNPEIIQTYPQAFKILEPLPQF